MRFKLIPIASLALSGCVFSFSSFAAEKNIGIEEVVVTARKQEESSQDIPIAITALTEELESSTVRNLTDLTGFIPNATIGEDGSRGGGGAVINIRGISPTRTDDNSFDAPVSVMIDGIYLGTLAGQVVENFDIERIEVLRGPQGTLFGKNTVGGLIHAIRSRPTGELGGKFKVTLGEEGQEELRAVLNTSLIEDKLAAKFFATSIQDDGFMKNVTIGGNTGETDYQNYGATFLWTPNDRFESTFTIERYDDNSQLSSYNTNYNAAPGVLPPPTDPNDSDFSGGLLTCTLSQIGVFGGVDGCRYSADTPSVSENDTENEAELTTDAYTWNMSYELNDNLSLVYTGGYREMEEYRIYDFDGSAAPFITIERWNEYDQTSHEFRIDGAYDNVTFTTGMYWFQNEFEQDWATAGAFWGILFGGALSAPGQWEACQAFDGTYTVACDRTIDAYPASSASLAQILYETQETTSYAAFAHVDWEFAENWTLTAGLRYTKEEKDFVAGQAYLTAVERQRNRDFFEYADLDNEWTETSPKVGLTYRINDDSLVYATYSEGFKSGGFFGVNQNVRDFVRDQYDPEKSESYEVGYKSTHMNNRLRFNLTWFRNDFIDKQEASVQVDPDTLTVATVFSNAADARYEGWELETQYVFNEYLRGFLAYGYLDAEYEEFFTDINTADGIAKIEDASFLTPRNAPEFTLGIGGTLSIPLGNGSLELYAKYTKIDEFESNLLNTQLGRVDAREDVTASIGYFTENWSVSAFGLNLTDEQVEVFVPVEPLFAVGNVNQGRRYGVELSYQF